MWPFKPPRHPDARTYAPAVDAQKGLPTDLRLASRFKRRQTTRHSFEQPPKRGMWVVHMGAVGILVDLRVGDVAVVAIVDPVRGDNQTALFTDDKGETKLQNVVRLVGAVELRQAWFEEIPKPRRPTLEAAEALGYSRAPK